MVRSANFITIQGLTPNKTYYIRVLAFTSVGDGPLSQDLQIIAKTGGKIGVVGEGWHVMIVSMYWIYKQKICSFLQKNYDHQLNSICITMCFFLMNSQPVSSSSS